MQYGGGNFVETNHAFNLSLLSGVVNSHAKPRWSSIVRSTWWKFEKQFGWVICDH